MCTLSVIAWNSGVRLAFNRDELRRRPIALPPRIVRCGQRRAVMPIDPPSGGSWIGVNDAGLACALLNVNPPYRPTDSFPRSRGLIVPELLRHGSLADAIVAILAQPLDEYPPFRIFLTNGRRHVSVRHDNGELSIAKYTSLPIMFTSSGLGDAIVEARRRRLFERLSPTTPATQDEFHRHHWPARPHLSVRMSRPDACTVSYSVIQLSAYGATFRYTDFREPNPHDSSDLHPAASFADAAY